MSLLYTHDEEGKPTKNLYADKWLSYKQREFKMNNFLISWKYQIPSENG